MTVGERILLAFSRAPGTGDREAASHEPAVDHALDDILRRLPRLREWIPGARVLDLGCGSGLQALAMARMGAAFVLGVDSNAATLRGARLRAERHGVDPGSLAFAESIPPEAAGSFDLVLSKDSMEHFADPAGVLAAMRGAIAPGGRLVVTFGPPWLAPSGSHMHFFTPVPWVHLLFPERTVMRVRARYRTDGATRYEEVESGLNRMTVGGFEALVRRNGLRVVQHRYDCVRRLDFLSRAPGLRELFINNVACVLVPEEA